MKKIVSLSLLVLLLTSCEKESEFDNTTYQENSSKSVKSNVAPLNKSEQILKFEDAFHSFNQNVEDLGQEKAEQIIREEAISYLSNRDIDYDDSRLTGELVVTALDEISKELKEMNP